MITASAPSPAIGVFDAVAETERAIAALTAIRGQLIAQAFAIVEAEQGERPGARSAHARSELARQTVVSELAPLLRIGLGAAANLLGESRALTAVLPATLAGLARGDFSYRHAQVIVDNALLLPDADVGAFETQAVAEAVRLNIPRFRDRLRRLRETAHPESIAVRRGRQFERRSVGIEPAADGMAWLTAYLPAETALAIDNRLDALAAAMRDPQDSRTFTQMRTDAFCDLMLRGEAEGLRRGVSAQVLVTVPALTLLGHDDDPATLEGYGPIPAEVARVLAGDATSWVRLLTHPETGAVLSVGRDRYKVPADMRLWLRARDETCRMVGCGRRASSSDVDHGHDWAHGGTTSVDNLAHLCKGDHGRKQRLGWRMKHLPGGTVEWTSPYGRTYRTEPSIVMRA